MRKKVVRASVMIAAVTLLGANVTATSQQGSKSRSSTKSQQSTQQKANQPTTVTLDDLQANPDKYIGKTVRVEGDVNRVLGPHLFSVHEKKWLVLDREMPVAVPEPFTALVRSGAPVRVTGVVQKVPIASIEHDTGLLSRTDKIRAEIENRPVLLASEVTTVTPALVSLRVLTDQPVATSGGRGPASITDANQISSAKDTNLVGRRVSISKAMITGTNDQGFWIQTSNGARVFVMPVKKTDVKQGQTADIEGVVLELPEGLRVQINGDQAQRIYVYADKVMPQ